VLASLSFDWSFISRQAVAEGPFPERLPQKSSRSEAEIPHGEAHVAREAFQFELTDDLAGAGLCT